MSKNADIPLLRKAYACIIQGSCTLPYNDDLIYIRHFSPIEQAEIDEEHLAVLNEAKKKGLPSEEDKLKDLAKEGLWTKEDEVDIENKKFYISSDESTKRAEFLPSRVEELNKKIQEGREKLRERLAARMELIGMTAESFASQKLNEIYIYKSFFKDKDFREAFFTPEEYDDLTREEIGYLINLYNDRIKEFQDRNIRRIACAAFFQNYYSLCEDNIYNLFGKAIVSLTFYQSELATYGRYFKHIIANSKPAEDILEDPDKLIDWSNGTQNTKKLLDDNKPQGEGVAMAIVGATADDLKKMGLKKDTGEKSFQEIAREKGGLSMEDIMKLSGVQR